MHSPMDDLPHWIIVLLTFCGICWAGDTPKCEAITVKYCKKLWYNTTAMPNRQRHQNQFDIEMEMESFTNLIEEKCSPEITTFLCDIFLPKCSVESSRLIVIQHPCRSDCLKVKSDCETYLKRDWPPILSCDNLPEDGACAALTPPTSHSGHYPGCANTLLFVVIVLITNFL